MIEYITESNKYAQAKGVVLGLKREDLIKLDKRTVQGRYNVMFIIEHSGFVSGNPFGN